MSDFDIANALMKEGDFESALARYDAVIAARPDHAAAHLNRGVALASLGRFDDAISSYDRAVAVKADVPEAFANRGAAWFAKRCFAEAERDFARASELKPDAASPRRQRGDALMELQRYDEALACYDRALALDPQTPHARRHRGHALMRLGKKVEALEVFAERLKLAPDDSDALADCGWALFELRQLDDALGAYDRATARSSGNASTHYNRALVLFELGRFDDASSAFSRAIALKPDHLGAHVNRGFCRLLTGDFDGGFADYEWRNPQDVVDLDPALRLTPDSARTLSGRRLLILSELGLGDTLQFARYLRELEARGASVVLDVTPKLHALLRTLNSRATFGTRDHVKGAYDGWARIISLPHILGETFGSLRASDSYLGAEAGRVARWRERLGPRGFKIGVCWRGQVRSELFPRGFPLSELAPLAGIAGVRLLSLKREERGDRAEIDAAGFDLETLGEDYDRGPDAFLDAAAVISNCDLVISCDTSLAHLAGALGAPVWLALKCVADWRWFRDRPDSPWYPSMRLFRQSRPGDWASVFAQMEAELRARVQSLGNSSPMAR